jgi:hypothetical protein
VNKAIEMKDDAHDFYLWRSQIYREMGRVEEANIDDIKWKELKKKVNPRRFGKYLKIKKGA